MNVTSLSSFFERFKYRIALYARLFDIHTDVSSFATPGSDDAIQRIYVINLDRKPARWNQVNKELSRFRGGTGSPLSSITRRFSAIDARYMVGDPDEKSLHPLYSLADQLLVEPNPQLRIDAKSRMQRIEMSRQEIAVALSHIEVWKLIASGDVQYTLVLEDDVYFRHGFSKSLDAAWLSLMRKSTANSAFDLFYLSYKAVGTGTKSEIQLSDSVKVPCCGLWYASGYVLSKDGARKLLALLPVHGPIDLWLNLQYGKLDVYMTQHSLIEQRIDVLSTNSYSIMPVLSQVGVYTREKPLVARLRELPSPVFAFGEPGSGLTAIATALSMLGYTCCSDIFSLPEQELNALLSKNGNRRFNAYVNIGSLGGQPLNTIAELYPDARFILTNPVEEHLSLPPGRVLNLPIEHRDKWSALSTFLKLEYPAFPFPVCNDNGQQEVDYCRNKQEVSLPCKNLKFDSSPWIVSSNKWHGITVSEVGQHDDSKAEVIQVCGGTELDCNYWRLRDDTFPSNLALFTTDNITLDPLGTTRLVIREETTPVRSFTSAAIASQQKYLYGTFAAELRPPNVSGLITGMFLHRNEPRQEIDIEFLGKDTTKMLVNVYYNPGVEGTRLQYGYRGTPTLIELGFDAAAEFHYYEIEWHAHMIRWRVDGCVVYERVLWNPTPIPNLPMEFNVNLWHSRSKELAGKIETKRLPAYVEIRSIRISKDNCCSKTRL